MSRKHTNPGGRLARRSLFKVPASLGAALVLASAAALPLGAAVVDFGDVALTMPPASSYTGPGGGGYYNGGDSAGSFASGGASFNNNYDTTYGSWGGFAYSTTTDTTTPGWANQYSAYNLGASTGAYAVAYYDAYTPSVPTISFGGAVAPQSVLVTNTTWTALDMLAGSSFSKKFGGATGNDADWFTVTFTGYDASNAVTGFTTFYLADYRFANNALDYVVSEWTSVDLTALGTGVTAIKLSFASSDVGLFGINTPTYAALDNLNFAAVPEPSAAAALAGLGALAVASLRRRRVSGATLAA